MERLIFVEFLKSGENPCRKRFEINPETSSRHISATVTDIATILQPGVSRATVYFPADFYFQSFSGLFLANFLRLFATFFGRRIPRKRSLLLTRSNFGCFADHHAWLRALQI
jgi:hypothetical protein